MGKIVDSDGLCEILNMKKRTLQGVWREYPHFFVAKGRDLRSARFDKEDVITFLKERTCNHGNMVQKKPGNLDVQVSTQQKDLRSLGFQDQKRSSKGREGQTTRVGKSTKPYDPYGILS